ncbi:uncharacterized protein EV420DRAFT_1524369 [Desarmillaria tabescens]|uniref:Uncharacterized protein n=1 Tax=Armillaria tabescens TaxID=1929756 RepID=A0AA39NB58_ARMTA|nr:uncharacterized protein EV420DRAFT_1524369 [Desarmillaria tabescens]KAK0462369.1 hypothetical protein EV420DRAFT_1524369 [Desarmillaria tabescens]
MLTTCLLHYSVVIRLFNSRAIIYCGYCNVPVVIIHSDDKDGPAGCFLAHLCLSSFVSWVRLAYYDY